MMFVLLLYSCIAARIPVETADVIECNTYYDEKGCEIFTQLIFWEWIPFAHDHHVVAWVFAKRASAITRVGNEWQVYVKDANGRLLRVRARSYRRTHTQHDPEIEDRKILPKQHRRGLAGARL